MSFTDNNRLCGGARKPVRLQSDKMLQARDMRVRIQTIAHCHPNRSPMEYRAILFEQTGELRSKEWVRKWTKVRPNETGDGRTTSSRRGNPKYSRAHKQQIIVHCVGLAHRRQPDGIRRESHSQLATAKWYKNRHPASKLNQTTVGAILKEAGFKWRIRPRRCRLTPENRNQRERFCRQWEEATGNDFLNIVFTDSTHVFYEHQANRHNEGCYVEDGEDVPPVTSHKHPTYEHVYGAHTQFGMAGPIYVESGLRVNSQIYREEVLPQLIKAINKIWNDHCEESDKREWILQQDGAPAHFAAATMPTLDRLLTRAPACYEGEDDEDDAKAAEDEFEYWPQYWRQSYWPASSADLSPIESVWPLLQQHVAQAGNEPKDRAECRERITDFFNTYSPDACRKLLRHMPNRVAACIRQNYFTTKY